MHFHTKEGRQSTTFDDYARQEHRWSSGQSAPHVPQPNAHSQPQTHAHPQPQPYAHPQPQFQPKCSSYSLFLKSVSQVPQLPRMSRSMWVGESN